MEMSCAATSCYMLPAALSLTSTAPVDQTGGIRTADVLRDRLTQELSEQDVVQVLADVPCRRKRDTASRLWMHVSGSAPHFGHARWRHQALHLQ
eukprot:53652-Eustigmatos_ZCMA.PRE.1